jgi:hypothetical protein
MNEDSPPLTVYIPFDDGSCVAYDGKRFSLYRRPVDIDADLRALSESEGGQAVRVWRERRKELVRALENAWWEQREKNWGQMTKRIYSVKKPPETASNG